MYIEKIARIKNNYRRTFLPFKNARTAFTSFLASLTFNPDMQEKVVLPAYIGWSEREGSGVFDPIRELGLPFEFYRIDEKLCIDIAHFRHIVETHRSKVVVIIHYFGHIDPNYETAVHIAQQHGALILEDEAHAMLTDIVGGISGRLGDASIFSLHKLLPVDRGGLLVFNTHNADTNLHTSYRDDTAPLPWDYDLKQIAEKRMENVACLNTLIPSLKGEVESLLTSLQPGEYLQTYPIIIKNVSRDALYFMMNEAGYGVVSLYHTLIAPITIEQYPHSHMLANHILNLPIHQDIPMSLFKNMILKLEECIETLLSTDTKAAP